MHLNPQSKRSPLYVTKPFSPAAMDMIYSWGVVFGWASLHRKGEFDLEGRC